MLFFFKINLSTFISIYKSSAMYTFFVSRFNLHIYHRFLCPTIHTTSSFEHKIHCFFLSQNSIFFIYKKIAKLLEISHLLMEQIYLHTSTFLTLKGKLIFQNLIVQHLNFYLLKQFVKDNRILKGLLISCVKLKNFHIILRCDLIKK